MRFTLASHSIVITANTHNPSILHPEFLARHGIVPDSWGWKLEGPPLSTPALSQVRFESGIALICDPSRLQIIDGGVAVDPDRNRLVDIASAYIKVLPHVPYTAVGINFNGAHQWDSPETVVASRFLAPGPWIDAVPPLQSVGLRFVYQLKAARLRVSVDAGEIRAPGSAPTKSVILEANYHQDCSGEDRAGEVAAIIGRSHEFWSDYQRVTEMLFGKD